ncbi:hypothetical protein A21D_00091 [Virgibacillus dokdonensis]|uniref:Uncharacterized protein n=1 Tax=Virgibacillus dokdonensis TaxID=302167 RepID=A0A2K9ITW3_9BACI|nr:hypothetical protein A21D_00091 [Virgibacillus dokdonensis]
MALLIVPIAQKEAKNTLIPLSFDNLELLTKKGKGEGKSAILSYHRIYWG